MERPTAYFFLEQQMLRLYLPLGLIPCFFVFGAAGIQQACGRVRRVLLLYTYLGCNDT